MSGADLLILQQSVKQYLLAKQTRELTSHEQEELVKIKELLVPALLRYTQPAAAADANSSTPHNNPSRDTRAGRLLPPKPISSRQSTVPEHRPSGAAKLTQTRIKSERPQPPQSASGPRPLGPSTIQNKEGAMLAPNSKKGTRKRLEIYHDDENAEPKRRRVKGGRDRGGDSDKENRNPADALSVNRTKRVLGEITNTAKNPPANQNQKDKSVLNSGTIGNKASLQGRYPSDTTRKINDASKPITATAKVDAQKEEETPTINRLAPRVTVANEPAVLDSTPTSTPIAIKGHKSSPAAEEPEATIVQRLGVSSDLTSVENGVVTPALAKTVAAPVVDCPSKHQPSIAQATTEKPTVAIPEDNAENEDLILRSLTPKDSTLAKASLSDACGITEIPGSVEDEQSATSFESSTKQARRTLVLNAPVAETSVTRANDLPEYEEVQDSQESLASQDVSFHKSPVPESPSMNEVREPQYTPSCRGSLEPTLPLPEFLLDREYEEVPDSQDSQSLQDVLLCSQDPTLPRPDFLLGYDSEGDQLLDSSDGAEANGTVRSRPVLTAKSIAVTSKPQAISRDNHPVTESTNLADGVWCIDDCHQEVVSIVCGHSDLWIAVEMAKEIQFWRLQSHKGLSKSRWCNLFTHKKNYARPHQIIFTPDDCLAVILNPVDTSYFLVQLDRIGPHKDVVKEIIMGSGVQPSLECKGLIMEREDARYSINGGPEHDYIIVLGASESGSLCLIPIPRWREDVHSETVEVELLPICSSQDTVSSFVKVENTSSLVLASFGTDLVLCDFYEGLPVCTTDLKLERPLGPCGFSSALPPTPTVLSATVPAVYLEEYPEHTSASSYPIMAVLQMHHGPGNSLDQDVEDSCALYAMKDGATELVHKYQNSHSLSVASSSSRFVMGQSKQDGKDRLYLWDLVQPEIAAQLSLQEPPSREHLASQGSLQRLQSKPMTEQDEVDTVSLDFFSDGSTLSTPPGVLSDSSEAEEVDRVQLLGRDESEEQLERPVSRQSDEWIELISVSWTEDKKVRFAVHPDQRWVVVAQQGKTIVGSTAIHILDMMTLLPFVAEA
ncbi:hypothetical protein EC968_005047 [Mortierella alpina]|nr:hypothetical protein EC968_005047 [Mortierella alpina]